MPTMGKSVQPDKETHGGRSPSHHGDIHIFEAFQQFDAELGVKFVNA